MALLAKKALPSAFTFGNLIFGLLSLLMTFQNNFKLASIFIIAAALMDRYDGRIARLLNTSSDLGKELDSLADLVSFGVAPSILLCFMYELISIGPMGYMLVLVFPVAGAYRLARYNSTEFDNVFTGIPITIAGALLALYGLMTYKSASNIPLTILLILLLSYLMISKLKFKKV